MRLFDKSATYRSKQIGLRDTAARFLRDLATNGIPMSLESLKAACESAAERPARCRSDAARPTDPHSFRLIAPIAPVDVLA